MAEEPEPESGASARRHMARQTPQQRKPRGQDESFHVGQGGLSQSSQMAITRSLPREEFACSMDSLGHVGEPLRTGSGSP